MTSRQCPKMATPARNLAGPSAWAHREEERRGTGDCYDTNSRMDSSKDAQQARAARHRGERRAHQFG